MANTITTQTIVDGDKHIVVHVYMKSDGLAGDVTNNVLVDPANFANINNLHVERVVGAFTGYSATLKWDATSPVGFMELPSTAPFDFNYQNDFKGIPNNAVTGKTGKLTMDTAGFTAATDSGFFTMYLRKN